MMTLMSLGLAFVLAVTIIYLWLAQKEILHLRKCCKEKEDGLLDSEKNDESTDLPSGVLADAQTGTLTIHDRVVEMHALGESTETIAQRLKIPQNQVAMTLKFEKMLTAQPQ